MPAQDVEDAEDAVPPNRASQIDDNLRKLYQEMVQDDIPDRFQDLLQKLRDQDSTPSGGDS